MLGLDLNVSRFRLERVAQNKVSLTMADISGFVPRRTRIFEDAMETDDSPPPREDFKREFMMALNAAAGNAKAIERYGQTMKLLLEKAGAGDELALLIMWINVF